jgi:2-keto-myo-inositol isomerase
VPFVHNDDGSLVSLRALREGGCRGPFSFEPFAPSVHKLADPAGALRESLSFVARETGLSA